MAAYNYREEFVFSAKLAEQMEIYDEMVHQVKKIACLDTELSAEERNLLSVAYKNQIGARRASWRIVSSITQRDESKKQNLEFLPKGKEYLIKIENEIADIANDVIQLIDKHLLPNANEIENQVFLFKMQADYFRYLAELRNQADIILKSHRCYQTATDIAKKSLPTTHPIRLGLALNYSVFCYEILRDAATSSQISKQAFDEAIADLDNLDEEAYKDATLIMQLLRDGLTLWVDDNSDEGDNM